MYNRTEYTGVPERILDSLDAYAKEGRPTGGFLDAVLRGDLYEAVARADSESMDALKMIVTYVNCQLPIGCWGSDERVKAWYAEKKVKHVAVGKP